MLYNTDTVAKIRCPRISTNGPFQIIINNKQTTTTMAPKTITVEDAGGNKEKETVGTEEGYKSLLNEYQVVCVRDSNGSKIRDFEALQDGGTYTLGPPQQQTQPQPALFSKEQAAALGRMAEDYAAKIQTIGENCSEKKLLLCTNSDSIVRDSLVTKDNHTIWRFDQTGRKAYLQYY